MRGSMICRAVLLFACLHCAAHAGTPTQWLGSLSVEGQFHCSFGVMPGSQDGYDGWDPFDVMARTGLYIMHARTNGPGWSGPTGFYTTEWESPIPSGGSHTWWDICLWAYDETPRYGDRAGIGYTHNIPAPVGYWGQLVLDYVPAHLNWTGDTEWFFPLWTKVDEYGIPPLPCPITDDPFNLDNVTRMHLTVYTYNPIPEPCSLVALALGLAGVGWRVRKR